MTMDRQRLAAEISDLRDVHFFQFMRVVSPRLFQLSDAEHLAVCGMQSNADRLGEVAVALRGGNISVEDAEAEAARLMKALPPLDEKSLADLARSRAMSDAMAGVDAAESNPVAAPDSEGTNE